MRIGMIFECGPHGADRKVCEHLARRISPDLEIKSETLDNKPNLLSDCGIVAAELQASGCERIVIIWDLYPPWRGKSQKPCRKEDRDDIFEALRTAGVDPAQVALVCIEEELEAWLLADERAIANVLSKPHRPTRIKRRRNVEQIRNPKSVLRDIFRQNGRHDYSDHIHAARIAQAIPDFQRLRRVETFRRFALKVADVEL